MAGTDLSLVLPVAPRRDSINPDSSNDWGPTAHVLQRRDGRWARAS